MTNFTSDEFERRVHRIYELLENSGATVKCNDHLKDPDNPEQTRQIDVSIMRGADLTIVECRHRNQPQDVTWIEELIGRRVSLGAVAAIAVSSSGFTSGALKKSKAYGILTRELRLITEAEVAGWGRQLSLALFFYEYSDLQLHLLLESQGGFDDEKARQQLRSYPGLQSIFNAAASTLDDLKLIARRDFGWITFDLRMELENFKLCGIHVIEVHLHGRGRLACREVSCPGIFEFGEPNIDSEGSEATIQVFDLGTSNVVSVTDRIGVTIDISKVDLPPFSQCRFFEFKSRDELSYEYFEIVGTDRLGYLQGTLDVHFSCTRAPSCT